VCSSDGVRSVYAQFAKLPRLTRECAPALYAYLDEGEQQPPAQQGAGAEDTDAAAAPPAVAEAAGAEGSVGGATEGIGLDNALSGQKAQGQGPSDVDMDAGQQPQT